MTSSEALSHTQALQVVQQAVAILAKWADAKLPSECQTIEDSDPIARAKKLLSWTKDAEIKPLRLLFDQVKLSQGQNETHYWKAEAIADYHPLIPYPQTEEPTPAELECLKLQIQDEINQLKVNQHGWQNLSFLTLILEKFGSFLSFVKSDVPLIDIARTTGAIAAALASNPHASELSLVAGDLSGIQKFIYTISSDGALKSLRARSFYLELVTQEVIEQLLEELKLPRTNVIYAGGGKLYLLAPAIQMTKRVVEQIRNQFNDWLLGRFQGKLFLALDYLNFPIEVLAGNESQSVPEKTFADYWSEVVTKNLAQQKACKFNLEPQISRLMRKRRGNEPCKVCHRDDTRTLKRLNDNEPDSPLACVTCREMFRLGGRLFKVEAVVRKAKKRSQLVKIPSAFTLSFPHAYYYLFPDQEKAFTTIQSPDSILLINNWALKDYHSDKVAPLLLGNYGQRGLKEPETPDEPVSFMSAGEMAEVAEKSGCIPRIGYLRMDVDRLGQIFAKGLDKNHFLPRLAGLSRQMSYFFKIYLNSLAESRKTNLPSSVEKLTDNERPNLLFIYAGGDDLFISGAWNEVVEFAFDVYQSFREYTGKNPDITLSGGISIAAAKYPLYQAANESGQAENNAKANGRDSLGLFGESFKWSEWLGKTDVSIVQSREQEYWEKIKAKPDKPKLLGVFPFVNRLTQKKIALNYSRNFVRNLLITAQLQEQMIQEIKDTRKLKQYDEQVQDIRYYLHLPQIAYTLSRLPKRVLDDDDFRQGFKSPYNAPYFRAIATWIELLTRSSNL